jgi:uncharacterized protein (DUF924 family)
LRQLQIPHFANMLDSSQTLEYARLRLAASPWMNRETPSMLSLGWTNDVLKFWFDEAGWDRWFGKDATFDDPELVKWADAHRSIIIRFGRFPHRNRVLGRTSTPEETEFLTQADSSF